MTCTKSVVSSAAKMNILAVELTLPQEKHRMGMIILTTVLTKFW